MNIKSVTNSIIQTEGIEPKKETKTLESDKDRDPSQNSGGDQGKQEQHTEEDVQKALEYLKNHPGIKKSNLKVSLEMVNSARLFLVKDHLGKVVRRLEVVEAIQSSRQADIDTKNQRGRLLNKAM